MPASGRHRHHQPARNHRGMGPRNRRAGVQRHRLAVAPFGRDLQAHARRPGREAACASAPACCLMPIFRHQDSSGCSTTSRACERAAAWRIAVRHHRYLADLEPDRRQGTRHRHHQRLAHAAVRHPRQCWDAELLELFDVPESMLPEVRSCSEDIRPHRSDGTSSVATCRSAAWPATSRRRCSGRPASSPGMAKNTYGTGCFVLMHTGEEASAITSTAC